MDNPHLLPERDVDLSIFLPVDPGVHVQAPLEILDLPERDCLVAEVRGSYDQISEAHDLINARLAEENLALPGDGGVAGKAFNRYLTTPDQVSEQELITEVCQPGVHALHRRRHFCGSAVATVSRPAARA